MSVRRYGDWDRALEVMRGIEAKYDRAVNRGLHRVGVHVRDKIKRGIRDQAPGGKEFVPLHPATVAAKGSSKALIDNGDMVGAITYKITSPEQVFVGLLRTAKNKQGEELANLGHIHEYGRIVRVTPKMRGYLAAVLGLHLKPETIAITIPARPFLRPVLNAEKDEVVKIFQKELQEIFLK